MKNSTVLLLVVTFVVCMLSCVVHGSYSHYNETCSADSLSACNNGQFICVNGTCQSCTESTQCQGYSFIVCKNTTITLPDGSPHQVGQCIQRSLIPPTWRDIVISIFCFIGGGAAASAGIGGGGIYVPAMLLFGGYSAQVAVPLSTVIIFGASIANWAMLAPQKHPTANNRPLINYSASLILQPIILCGSALGVFLNTVIPNWLLVALLVALITFTTFKTVKKGLDLRRKEAQATALASTDIPTTPQTASDEQLDEEIQEEEQLEAEEVSNERNEEMEDINLKQEVNEQEEEQNSEPGETKNEGTLAFDLESKQYPWQVLVLLVVPWLIVLVTSLLNGSKKAPSMVGIKQCSPVFWLVMAAQYPILFGYSFVIGYFYYRQYKKKLEMNYKFEEGDIEWNKRNIFIIPCAFMTAGLVGGLAGIGGGMITGPLLLSLGAPPQVSVATSSFMIFFTSSSAAAQFFVIGAIPIDYGLWYGVLGFFSGLIGQYIVGKVMKKYNKASVVVFFVVTVISISCVSMIGTGIYRTITDIQSQGVKALMFKPLC